MTNEDLEKRIKILEESVKRLQAIEDVEAIKKLHRQYIYWLNTHQWDDMITCFTEDASVFLQKHGPHKGREQLEVLFKDKVANTQKPGNAHTVTEPVIEVDGDTATGKWILFIYCLKYNPLARAELKWIQQGKHDCEYRKENGKWKISSLKYTRPWPENELA